MRTFVVGGAVRDVLMGREPKDLDYVVVGATPQDMIDMGFKQVGADFPVFLNDKGVEYALARTERKVGSGYHGFQVQYDPDVTLEDDLKRRDLTINAMAVPSIDWERFVHTRDRSLVIDPHGGLGDLQEKRLSHVSDAFAEDPVRVLRVARFIGRYNGFVVAKETKTMMKFLVDTGELDHLTPERVWTEFEKGLMEPNPQEFIATLGQVGALNVLFPAPFAAMGCFGQFSLREAAMLNLDLADRMAIVFHELPIDQLDQLCSKIKMPNAIREFIEKVSLVRDYATGGFPSAEDVLGVINGVGAHRSPEMLIRITRLARLALTSSCIGTDNTGMVLLAVARDVAAITFATLPADQQASLKGQQIANAIREARLKVIRKRLHVP